ncbi:magnesium transporter CorA family protein [Tepidibacter aestuarii]|uniref:magnesium transporter CorA family protein n=1 Tax=Tepidibacter aestuarii TaxID=2925782 RepID=UPI0020BDEB2E|nr:magnesium transporter CorA family protein [Tepidibacter aestuarii]CAH2212464.1 magnesium transporter [Tepidibacter aestuarii]
MIRVYKTIDEKLVKLDNIERDTWVNLTNPTQEEINKVCDMFNIECDHIKAALDEEESSRIETEENYTVILVDLPIIEKEKDSEFYATIPLGVILSKEYIVTICIRETSILNDFFTGKVKGFSTFKKTRFILQVLYKNATLYLQCLRHIDRKSNQIEKELHKSTENKKIFQLLSLEKSLVYFTTSLRANEIVLEKMLRLENIKQYAEDKELLQDVIIENKQAIEMANIYSNILSSMMDAFSSIISNNLNIVMKFLTSVTIVMSIPTIVASFYGMNVNIPLSQNPHAFSIVLFISFFLSSIIAAIMAKKKMF